jgi:hypothetical protein
MQQSGARECVPVMFTKQELAVIDHYRFERRIRTRAQAVRELLRRGLIADGVEMRSADEKPQ